MISLFLKPLLSLFGGPIINGLLDGYKAKLAAGNTTERHAVDLAKKEIEADIEAKAEARKIIIAEQGWWVTAMIRPMFAFPLILYWSKIVIWDKMLGWGVTDAITGAPGEWAGVIIGAYFLGRSGEKIAKTIMLRKA